MGALPDRGDKVLAVAVVKGAGSFVPPSSKTIEFDGYEWTVAHAISERNGVPNVYDPANVSVDSDGHLHLRIVRRSDRWTCSEVILPHSFGYGTYRFSVEDISHLEPAVVLTLFTWDDLGAEQNHREMDVEISRWGGSFRQERAICSATILCPGECRTVLCAARKTDLFFRMGAGKDIVRSRHGRRWDLAAGFRSIPCVYFGHSFLRKRVCQHEFLRFRLL